MKTLTINIPDSLELNDREACMLLATRLFEQGKLSSGQAAEMAGYSKRTFIELLASYNVSIFNYNINELKEDMRNAASSHI